MGDHINTTVDHGANEHTHEIVIKINLEDVFHNRQCHPDKPDPGTVIYYLYRVDKQQFETKDPMLTGRQLLAAVGLTPDKYRLFELGHGQAEIQPDEIVDLRKLGIERFKSVAKHANEGYQVANSATQPYVLRRSVDLLADDQQYLDQRYPGWETILEGNTGWILLPNFKVPEGYNQGDVAVAFMIPPSYPTIEFDMMYFYPALSRKDGLPIGALSVQALDGKHYQRWSRHRNAGEWRPGYDNLETHVVSVSAWLMDEFKKR